MVSPRLLGDLICAIFAGTIAVFVHAQEEEGWVTFDGNQYGFFDHEATFDEAEEICVQYGGHLVSIHSQAENDFVHCGVFAFGIVDFEEKGDSIHFSLIAVKNGPGDMASSDLAN